MFRISFSPGKIADGFKTCLPMQDALRSRHIDAKTLAECEAAFNEAVKDASLVPESVIARHFEGLGEHNGHTYAVAVCAWWVTGSRAPRGVKARKWEAWPVVGVPPSWPEHLTGATEAQQKALFQVWQRPLTQDKPDWPAFAAGAHLSRDGLMVQWCGMWLGIEPDGYTHS